MTFLRVGTAKKNFEKISPYKDTIERAMYKRAGMVSHAQIVAGPDIERHVRNARGLVATSEIATVKIIDNDWHVNQKQNEWLSGDNCNIKGNPSWQAVVPGGDGRWYKEGAILHIKHNVSVVAADLAYVDTLERFVDADLMGTVTGYAGHVISTVLNTQATLYPYERTNDKKKCLIFTFAMRPVGESVTLEWIKNLIKINLGSSVSIGVKASMTKAPNATIKTNGFKGVGVYNYDINGFNNGRLEDMCLYYYNETGFPMITGMVVYR